MPPQFQFFFKDLAALIAVLTITVLSLYFVASALRRRQQNEMQRHILDKFSSAKDFADFVQSPAGQKYVTGFTDAVTSPRNSILTSLRTGIVLIGLGAGMATGHFADSAATDVLHTGANIAICVGLAFVASAVFSYFLARKVGSEGKE
jgi:hypothetical protein